RGIGIIVARVCGSLFAIDKVADRTVHSLYNQSVPAFRVFKALVALIVRIPGFDLYGFPGSEGEGHRRQAPAAVGQVFEIHLAVFGLQRLFIRRNGVERLHYLVTVWTGGRLVAKMDTRRVGA